jgi:putative FmdB family regulatory protein
MPIYQYRCRSCGYIFDRLKSMDATGMEKCATCGEQADKIMSRPARFVRGPGWASRVDTPMPGEV